MKALMAFLLICSALPSYADYVCEGEYMAKIEKMAANQRSRSLSLGVGIAAGGVTGLAGGFALGAALGPTGASIGMMAGAGAGMALVGSLDRSDSIITAHQLFKLSELSEQEARVNQDPNKKNEMDRLLQSLNRKRSEKLTYENVRLEVLRLSDSHSPCETNKLMGFKKLEKIVAENLQ